MTRQMGVHCFVLYSIFSSPPFFWTGFAPYVLFLAGSATASLMAGAVSIRVLHFSRHQVAVLAAFC